jgi:hypothetical protein
MEMVMGYFLGKLWGELKAHDRRSTAIFNFEQCLSASALGAWYTRPFIVAVRTMNAKLKGEPKVFSLPLNHPEVIGFMFYL